MSSDIEDKVRTHGGPLLSRLANVQKRAADISMKRRPPKISNPAEWGDDHIYIDVTLKDVASAIGKMDVLTKTCPLCEEVFLTRGALKSHLLKGH